MDILIRPESSRDHAAIHELTTRAFAPVPYAQGDEQELIDRLRKAGALALSLVAEQGGEIVGHIAFSPAFAADGSPGWYALAPVSVEPRLQRQGIGRMLIEAGIRRLHERGAAGCVLVGDPDYYGRFGFQPSPELAPDGMPAEYFMILPLGTAKPDTVVGFHPILGGNSAEGH